MKFALQEIRYCISTFTGAKSVDGYALLLPAPFHGLRFCVRKMAEREWRVDHFDSGMAVIGPVVDVLETRKTKLAYMRKWQLDGHSMERVIFWLIRYMRHCHRTGKLGQRFASAGYEWCLKEAGL